MATEITYVPVVIYTLHHKIEGILTLQKGERLTDKLNVGERIFESITEAKVWSIANDALLYECPCLAVNKNQISLMIPKETAAN